LFIFCKHKLFIGIDCLFMFYWCKQTAQFLYIFIKPLKVINMDIK
jgi:hypothetical protein